jgi:hypothetical protein
MDPATIFALAEAATKLVGVISNSVSQGQVAMSTNDMATLNSILAPMHAQSLTLSATLDAAARAAE